MGIAQFPLSGNGHNINIYQTIFGYFNRRTSFPSTLVKRTYARRADTMGKSKKNKSKQETPEAEAVPAPPPVEDPGASKDTSLLRAEKTRENPKKNNKTNRTSATEPHSVVSACVPAPCRPIASEAVAVAPAWQMCLARRVPPSCPPRSTLSTYPLSQS